MSGAAERVAGELGRADAGLIRGLHATGEDPAGVLRAIARAGHDQRVRRP